MRNLNPVAIFGIVIAVYFPGFMAIAKEKPVHKKPPYTSIDSSLKCTVESNRKTIRDPVNYPGAYEEGYQLGLKARSGAMSMQSPTVSGEIARGYSDGYQMKPYAGQSTIVPTINKVKCGCRLRILKDAFFESDIEATCQSSRHETQSGGHSDAYHPNAYNDGFREGIASKANRETYKARTAGGEFARGFEEGYFGRANSGQRYTQMPINDYRCDCSLNTRSPLVPTAP